METKNFKCAWTIGELKQYCEKNGCRYEINPIYSEEHYNPFSGETKRFLLGYEMGINNIACKNGNSSYQWTWFETLDCVDDNIKLDDMRALFLHRYSQVTGEYHKGFNAMFQTHRTLSRLM